MNHSSSFIGLIDGVKYKFKNTIDAEKASYLARVILEELRDLTTSQSVGLCYPYRFGYPWPEKARLAYANGQMDFRRCQSRNICSVCARSHEAKMREKFHKSIDDYFSRGFSVYWQTLEVGYEPELPLNQRYRLIKGMFSEIVKHSAIRRIRGKFEVAFYLVVEVTLVAGNWAPHLHIVWVFDPRCNDDQASDLLDLVSRSWSSMRLKTAGVFSNNRTLFSEQLGEAGTEGLAWYLHKSFWLDVSNNSDPQHEPKTPLDFLLSFLATGEVEHLEKWRQYEEAVTRVQRFRFSRNWHSN